MDNLFVGATFCGESTKNSNKEDIEEWLGDSGVPSNIKYTNNKLTTVEEYRIDVTVVNVQNMKCELKGMVNMKLQGKGGFKLNKVLYMYLKLSRIYRLYRG